MKTPTLTEILQAFKVLHADSTPGEWSKGRTTHETVAVRPDQEPYRVAEFRHSADAQFCDAAHAYLPQVLQYIEQLEAQVEALKKVADGLPWYDFAGVKYDTPVKANAAIATLEDLGYTHKGGVRWQPPLGSVPNFDLVDQWRSKAEELEAQAVALLTALKETQSACDVSQCPWCGFWGPEYRDSAQPAAYCHHEFTLKPWQMFAALDQKGGA